MATRGRTGLTGAAGEYHVAAELSRRGWLATVTIKNAPGTDVLAQHLDTGRIVSIQTKTASQGSQSRLSVKDERTTQADNEWYALVRLQTLAERPQFYLVPRNVAATLVYVTHRKWLREPGRGGRKRNDSNVRQIFWEHVQPYLERWDLLELPTSDVPFDIPDWIRDAAREVGLQDNHPEAERCAPVRKSV